MRTTGRTWTWTRAFLSALVLALSAPSALADESGAQAPLDCWPMEDGCASRSCETPTPPVVGDLEVAWTYALEGATVAGEPRLWKDLVYVPTREAGGDGGVHVLRLHDGTRVGAVLARPNAIPRDLCVWRDTVLVRTDARTLEAFRQRGGQWNSVWKASSADEMFDPLMIGSTVYVREGKAVVRYDLPSTTSRWQQSGTYRGRLSFREGTLYALEYDEAGNGSLVAFHGTSGARLGSWFVGHHGLKAPPPVEFGSRIALLPGFALVQHSLPVRTAEKGSANVSMLAGNPGGAMPILVDEGLTTSRAPTAAAGALMLDLEEDEKEGLRLRLWEKAERGRRGYVLASREEHPEFVLPGFPFTVAKHVAYVGGRAFDTRSYVIVWDSGRKLEFRPVVSRERLVVVPDAQHVQALRTKTRPQTEALWYGPAAAAAPEGTPPAALESPGLLLEQDGDLRSGTFRVDSASGKIEHVEPKAVTPVPLEATRLLLGADGVLLYAASLVRVEEDVLAVRRRDHADEFVKLAKDAYKGNDPPHMAEFLGEASERGAPAKDMTPLWKQYSDLSRRSPKPSKSVSEKLESRAIALRTEERDAQGKVMEGLFSDARWPVRRWAAEGRLRIVDRDPLAAEVVRREVPEFLKPPPDWNPLEWIDVAEALRRSKVRPVAAPQRETKDMTPQQRELGSALHAWRPDLVGFESDDLMVITSLAQPGRIAMCVSMGELVSSALKSVFSTGTHVRKDPWPMILLLFETRDEYMAVSTRGEDSRGVARMEWSGGHYDPNAGLSRIWLPSTKDAFEEVMLTYAHELTHHWIDWRCPLFTAGEVRRKDSAPGYWIVEGMADFVSEFRWDLAGRAWESFNPRADSLDSVANAGEKIRLPWAKLFAVSSRTFDDLGHKDDLRIQRRWQLAHKSGTSPARMFYRQSAAVCQYLYHSGDAPRAALLQYVRDYYTGSGDLSAASFPTRFGMDADELGRKVVEYSRAVLDGTFVPGK